MATDCLPLILIDGRIVSQGAYPTRAELAGWAGLDGEPAPTLYSESVAELIAIGAAIAANCEPCFKYHYDKARTRGVSVGATLSTQPTAILAVPRLYALKHRPEAAAREYRERVVGPYRGVLPQAAVASIDEQLSGACTVEIAAFDEFSKLLGNPATPTGFDHVVFDTAPTGHTLRLLEVNVRNGWRLVPHAAPGDLAEARSPAPANRVARRIAAQGNVVGTGPRIEKPTADFTDSRNYTD